MRLILLRHGETHSNVIGALDTAIPGAPLDVLGLRQVAAVPEALAGENIGSIYASTILRAQQSAEPLAEARGLPVQILDGLREIEAGSLEMLNDPKSQGIYNATAFAWAKGDFQVRMPGGEDGVEFFERFDAAIREIIATHHETAVAVSHGAAIRTWVAARCRNTDGRFAGSHTLDNTGRAVLGGERLREWDLLDWMPTPAGGAGLSDARAVDPQGRALEKNASA